ncbi:MAG: hypothetical protein HC830_14850 [Bacteroidetes bacterium]|nr:hypothetical protein [Bacteroidales bacterium]NJO70380.1 hypothetical protein [Bacteroidota bacterium]
MKKILLFVCVSVFALGSVLANDSELFSYDKAKVQKAVSDMSQVEQMINQNPDVSVDDLMAQGKLNASFDATAASPFSVMGEPPLGIPSFLWGCILGWVGLLIVYLITEDKEETKKALWGCVAASVAWIVFYFAFWGAVFASAA